MSSETLREGFSFPGDSALNRFASKKLNEAAEKGKIEGMTIIKHQVNVRISSPEYVMLKHFAALTDESVSSFATGLLESAILDYGKLYGMPEKSTPEWFEHYKDALIAEVGVVESKIEDAQ